MINIYIISGFLGAGKTTMIKKLINNINGKKVIIENEFGDIGIDGEVLKRENYDVVELAQGCICCSLKENFKNTIESVMEEYNPDSIIIEPTGIAKLSDILYEFKHSNRFKQCLLHAPVTVVDALDYLQQAEDFGGFFKDQIRNAGIIALSKTQLMKQDNLSEVIKSIRKINVNAVIISNCWEEYTEIEYNMLVNTLYDSDMKIRFIDQMKDMGRSFQSFCTTYPKEFSRDALVKMLDSLSLEGKGRIIRAKGFVQGSDGDLEFSYINGRYSIGINKLHNSSRICLIGCNLDKDTFSDMLVKQYA